MKKLIDVPLHVIHLNQDDPKKCTAKKLGSYGLVKLHETMKFIPRRGFLLDPTAKISKRIIPESRKDFREHLEDIPKGTVLYNVIGILDGKSVKMGVIQTTSEFVSSKYGDKKLFFQHRR